METREEIVRKLMGEDERLQYDKDDPQRIFDSAQNTTQAFVSLLNTVAEYRDELLKEVDEDSASRMKEARRAVVEAYATALVDLHKLGATFRITGEAFDRLVGNLSGPEEAPLVMTGL
jgi:hypothetical protein